MPKRQRRQNTLMAAGEMRSRLGRGDSQEVSRGLEPRSLDSESRVLTLTPRDQLARFGMCAYFFTKLLSLGQSGTKKRLFESH